MDGSPRSCGKRKKRSRQSRGLAITLRSLRWILTHGVLLARTPIELRLGSWDFRTSVGNVVIHCILGISVKPLLHLSVRFFG